MMPSWTEEERRTLLRSRAGALLAYEGAMSMAAQAPPWSQDEDEAIASAEKYLAAIQRAEHSYFERLPHKVMSCCPFCAEPLVRTFDPFGVDGPWWRSDATPEEPPSCPHFCVLLGAIQFAGYQPESADFEVSCGPEVPYVVPHLLRQPSMRAVVSSIPMEPGYAAYPIAYFAEEGPSRQKSTAGWARRIYTYIEPDRRARWRIDNYQWDFDLLPWLKADLLLWCPPGSDNSFLNSDPHAACPYVNLPGRRVRLVIDRSRLSERGLPDGLPISC